MNIRNFKPVVVLAALASITALSFAETKVVNRTDDHVEVSLIDCDGHSRGRIHLEPGYRTSFNATAKSDWQLRIGHNLFEIGSLARSGYAHREDDGCYHVTIKEALVHYRPPHHDDDHHHD